MALVRDRRAFPEDCARAAVVITGLVAPPTCTRPLVIDRRVLAAHGAVALRAEGDGFAARYTHTNGRAVPWRPGAAREPGPRQPVTAESDGSRAAENGASAPTPEPDGSGNGAVSGDAPVEPLQ